MKADVLASKDLTTATQKQMFVVQAQRKTKRAPLVKDELLNKQKLNSSLSPTILSYEKYKTLQAQSQQKTLYWLLQQETDSSYVIELFITEQTSIFYRLNKNSFQLNKSSEDKEKPFAEITYIAENEA
jgi:hypothetical protein